jgi:hypothetical protein
MLPYGFAPVGSSIIKPITTSPPPESATVVPFFRASVPFFPFGDAVPVSVAVAVSLSVDGLAWGEGMLRG